MKRFSNDVKGSILVLAAIMIFVLFWMLALAIDLVYFATAREQHEHLAEVASVAALNAFLEKYDGANPGGTAAVAIQNAVDRVKEITKKNDLISHDGHHLQSIGSPLTGPGANGEITLGRWWFNCDPAEGCHACSAGEACFDDNGGTGAFTASGDYGSALTLTMRIDPASPIPIHFSKLLGLTGFLSTVQATSVNVPQRGLFLVDLSDSMQEDTHLAPVSLWKVPPYGSTSHFAYKLLDPASGSLADPNDIDNDGNFTACPAGHRCDCDDAGTRWNVQLYQEFYGGSLFMGHGRPGHPVPAGCAATANDGTDVLNDRDCYQNPDNLPMDTETRPAGYNSASGSCEDDLPDADNDGRPDQLGAGNNQCHYGGLRDTRPGPPVAPPLFPTADVHFKDDYLCYTITWDRDGGPAVGFGVPDGSSDATYTEHYLIDRYQSLPADITLASYYPGAQPLSTVLTALFFASEEFKARHVSGDMMGVTFFDQFNLLGTSFVDRDFPLVRPGEDPGNPSDSTITFGDLQNAVDILGVRASALPYPQNLVEHVTFPRRSTDPIPQPVLTNVPNALEHALQKLEQAPGSDGANNWIFLISDGMTNCRRDESGNDSIPTECNGPDYTMWYNSAYVDTYGDIGTRLAEQRIPVHYLAVGAQAGPNTLRIVDSGGNLIDDGTARQHDVPFVYVGTSSLDHSLLQTAYDNMAITNPFYFATYIFYQLTRKTRGFYFSLRPIDPLSGVGNTATNAGPGTAGLLSKPLDDVLGMSHDEQAFQTWIGAPWAAGFEPRYIQRYDPTGRTPQQQVNEFIDELFDLNSVILVNNPGG